MVRAVFLSIVHLLFFFLQHTKTIYKYSLFLFMVLLKYYLV